MRPRAAGPATCTCSYSKQPKAMDDGQYYARTRRKDEGMERSELTVSPPSLPLTESFPSGRLGRDTIKDRIRHDTILDSTELDGCNWTSDVDCANRREPVVGSAIVTSLQLAALGYYHAATGASPAGLGARKMGPLERQGAGLVEKNETSDELGG
ncbi:hypothetical protein NXS19_003253 [Fusarium pseudograminearum]|nr:hypothetical protein NXS19_003253 [Fusarium pseudograminearum]